MTPSLSQFQHDQFPMSQEYQYWLDHRNGRGIVEYCRTDAIGKFWIAGGWEPVKQQAQAVKAIRHAITLTAESQKEIGRQFLSDYLTWAKTLTE